VGAAVLARQRAEDLVVLREAVALLLLREDQRPVDDDVELTRLARLELCVDAGGLLDRGRETRGLRFVVSDEAVEDRDLHGAQNMGAGAGARKVSAVLGERERERGAHDGQDQSGIDDRAAADTARSRSGVGAHG